ncbi:MAG: peptidase T, partial [Promethearchaeota archaeon]
MNLSKEIQEFLLNESLERFLRYAKVWTTSSIESDTIPSTRNQLELAKILTKELKELELKDVVQDELGFVYGYLPPSKGNEETRSIGFIAHLDTSESVSGQDVKPVIHKNYNGTKIKYAQNKEITLSIEDSPNLEQYIGLDIITSQGDTLLGADDKAGIAEIMAALAAWKNYAELKHGPIFICFTTDEETGKGVINKVDKKKLPKVCYTLDGGEMGELEIECFDAWRVDINFKGLNVHTGYAKNLLINAGHIACRFLSELPEAESPEHTEEREGFFHLTKLQGRTEEAYARLLIRDYEVKSNEKRMEYIKKLKDLYEFRYPGLKIELNFSNQYKNMLNYIKKDKAIIDFAKKAIEQAGLVLKIKSARGGTDGSQLSELGIPTPNLFTGGELFHSRKEYIPTLALQKATEVLIY